MKPSADVGWHVDHQPSSWDLVYRAELSYAEMAPHSDFIKFIGYHNVLSPRIRDWYLRAFRSRSSASSRSRRRSSSTTTCSATTSGSSRRSVSWASAASRPTTSCAKRKRSVASAKGKTKIYTGIGFDVPGSPRDDPDTIYQATLNAFTAGAHGIVVSREYEEMKVENLRAVGRAMASLSR